MTDRFEAKTACFRGGKHGFSVSEKAGKCVCVTDRLTRWCFLFFFFSSEWKNVPRSVPMCVFAAITAAFLSSKHQAIRFPANQVERRET